VVEDGELVAVTMTTPKDSKKEESMSTPEWEGQRRSKRGSIWAFSILCSRIKPRYYVLDLWRF
jgi:hypothetical protein